MAYAIEMFFDNASEARIRSLWDEFAKFGAAYMRDSGARPHVSLAAADSVDAPATRGLLERFAQTTQPFPLTLSAVGLFPAREPVVYLAPKVTPELLALHGVFSDEFVTVATGVW